MIKVFDLFMRRDVLLNRIEHEHTYYCSNFVVNDCRNISNLTNTIYDSKEIV